MVSTVGTLDINVRRLNGADPGSPVVALITPTYHHSLRRETIGAASGGSPSPRPGNGGRLRGNL